MKIRFLFFLVVAALVPAAHAQFGSGIVYDPTQSAHAIQQIEQASQLYTTAVATRNQIVTMYNLAYQMAQMPQNLAARYQADWSQWSSLQSTPNTYGNTSALVNALNYGALSQAQQGYSRAYVQAQSYPSGSYSSLDARTQATVANQYATSEICSGRHNQYPRHARHHPLRLAGLRAEAGQSRVRHLLERSVRADRECIARQDQLRHPASDPLPAGHQSTACRLRRAAVDCREAADRRPNRAVNNAIYFQQNFPNLMQQTTGGITQAIQSISLSPNGR